MGRILVPKEDVGRGGRDDVWPHVWYEGSGGARAVVARRKRGMAWYLVKARVPGEVIKAETGEVIKAETGACWRGRCSARIKFCQERWWGVCGEGLFCGC